MLAIVERLPAFLEIILTPHASKLSRASHRHIRFVYRDFQDFRCFFFTAQIENLSYFYFPSI